MQRNEADVVVLGGGPAGCVTALALAHRKLSAVVIERSNYEAPRLGETLPPLARPLLAELGVWERFVREEHTPSYGIRSAWGRDELYENDFIFNPYGAGWHIDRARFDALLAVAAEAAGAQVYRGAQLASIARVKAVAKAGAWELEIAQGGATHSYRAKFFVDASGRAAALARGQGARRVVYDHLIGAVAFLPADSTLDSFTLVEASERGWWYSALLPSSEFVMAYMTDADLYARGARDSACYWREQLEVARHTRARANGFDLRIAPRIAPAGSSLLDPVAGANWLAVGDAALTFDPLSAQGICRALEFGPRAAVAIAAHLAGDAAALAAYAHAVAARFNDYLLARQTFYGRERRWPDSAFWQRRQVAAAAHLPGYARDTRGYTSDSPS